MAVTAQQVKALRVKTSAGMLDCKKALTETNGDVEAAVVLLRKRGIADASSRAGRKTAQGLVASYIHAGGKIGVLIEVNCESDFVSRNDVFQQFVKDLCLQVCSANPLYLAPEDVPAEALAREKEIYVEQARSTGKPDNVLEKIAEGKMRKFYETVCLLEQPFVREPKVRIKDLVKETITKLGENIKVSRFARFGVGEGAESEKVEDSGAEE